MRRLSICVVILLSLPNCGWALEGQEESPPPQQPQQRPTLGPAPAPSLHGPRTSTTNDPHKLLQIRTIFVEHMNNLLSEKLMDGIGKMGRFRVVAERKQADAVLRGTCEDFRRLKSLRSEVYITDRRGSSVWQDSIHRPFNPPTLDKAVDESVLLVLEHLGDSLREAERK
jgi:hypothetical protein